MFGRGRLRPIQRVAVWRPAFKAIPHLQVGQLQQNRLVALPLTNTRQASIATPMSLLCYIGRHRPSVQSLSRGKHGGYVGLCDACGVPMERADKGGWRAADATYARDNNRVG